MTQVQWIGPRPSGGQIGVIFFIGTVGILVPGVQPVVLAALLAEHHIDLTQLGYAASVELLSMGLAASLAAALLPTQNLRVISCLASLLLCIGNWLTPAAMGETVTVLRAVTGFAGGILIWVVSCMIARSATPERWAGVYLIVQTVAQLLFVGAMSLWAGPKWGATGDLGVLAGAGVASSVASFLLPSGFAPLPKTAHAPMEGMPTPRGFAGLSVVFFLLMFIVTVWVYFEPIAQQSGLSAQVSENAVSLSLGSQVLGGMAATLCAGRLRWYPTLAACTLVDLAMVWLLGTHPTAGLFLLDAAVFGFIYPFILPFMVPMLIEADPSRRAAVLTNGVGLLGSGIGPALATLVISSENIAGALWLGAGCLFGAFSIATWLRFTR